MAERELWLAVLFQAINDACLGGATIREREEARRFLNIYCRDFLFVCQLAGVGAKAILKIYMEIKSQKNPAKSEMANFIRKKRNSEVERYL